MPTDRILAKQALQPGNPAGGPASQAFLGPGAHSFVSFPRESIPSLWTAIAVFHVCPAMRLCSCTCMLFFVVRVF